MSNFDEDIKRITDEILQDGTIDSIIREKVEAGFKEALESSFHYGKLRDVVKKRVEDVLIPYIEAYDMNSFVVKLDTILADIINSTTLVENKKILENFQFLMTEPDKREITIEELFSEYKELISEEIDSSGREVDCESGEPQYVPAEVSCEVEYLDDKSWSVYSYRTLDFRLNEDEEQSDELSYEVHLSRYKNSKDDENLYSITYNGEDSIRSLRRLNRFELLLMSLSRAGVKLRFPSDYFFDKDTDEVYLKAEPEAEIHYS